MSKKTREIGIAAALGAIVCWTLAVSMGAPHWAKAALALVGGCLAAGVSYRPREVWTTAKKEARAVFARFNRDSLKGFFSGAWSILEALTKVALAIVACVLAPVYIGGVVFGWCLKTLGVFGLLSFPTDVSVLRLDAAVILQFFAFLAMIPAVATLGVYWINQETAPLFSRRSLAVRFDKVADAFLARCKWVDDFFTETLMRHLFGVALLLLLLIPISIVLNLCAVLVLLVVLVDAFRLLGFFVLNVAMQCATSGRLAAMEGAALGGLACLLVYYRSGATFLAPALFAAAVGAASGIGVHRLRLVVEARHGESRLAY